MKPRAGLILISVFFGLLALVGISLYVKAIQSKLTENSVTIKVYTAKEDLAKDSNTSSILSLIETKEIPKNFVAQNAILSTSQIKGKTLITNVDQGDQLTENMFSTSEKAGIASEIPNGKRAVSIKVEEAQSVSEQLKKGNMVDIIASFDDQVSSVDTIKTIIQNALVLRGVSNVNSKGTFSSGQQSNKDKTVIVAVSLSDAEKLVFAEAHGKVWLILRPNKDEQTENSTVQNIDSITR